MDTTQDSRENGGKRRPQTGGQNRASQRPGQSAPEQRPRRILLVSGGSGIQNNAENT